MQLQNQSWPGICAASFSAVQHCCSQDPEVLSSVLSFQRLLAMWMMRIASPDTAATGAPPQLPLPTPVPFEFASLPVSTSGTHHV